MQPLPPPDTAQAQRFLSALDPNPDALFGFRTVDDRGDDRRLSVKAYGALDRGIRQSNDRAKNGKSCRPATLLTYMQGMGAGVFAVINELDGQGQRMANVTRIRALFVDADNRAAVARLQTFLAKTGLTPTALVESGGLDCDTPKLHAYWRITGCPVAEFRDAQLALVSRLGTDPAVQDRSRVMRLPGFWHLKREPRQTRIVSLTDSAYEFRSFVSRVKAEPQVVDPWAGGKGRGAGAGRRAGTVTSATAIVPTARLRVLLGRSGGLLTPAVRTLLREAVAPSDGQPGNRHATLVAVTARCMQAGWRDEDVRELVLPVINGQWGDGDWREHLDQVIDWTRRQEAAAIATATAAPSHIVKAFSAGGVAGGA